jgi:two-component system, OmpR family, sensor histidine kinase ChvG
VWAIAIARPEVFPAGVLKRADIGDDLGPVGLDDRPRPSSARARLVRGLRQSAPFSSLQRRIIFFNLIGLTFLVVGMSYLSNGRQNLIEVYVDALRRHGEIIAIAIAETAAVDDGGALVYDPQEAATILARLSRPTGVRVRLYDTQRRLTADSFDLWPAGAPLEISRLSPPDEGIVTRLARQVDDFFDRLGPASPGEADIHLEVPVPGITPDEEVEQAAEGQVAHKVRVNAEDEVVVSVAMPVRRLKGIIGVLQLSTNGGEIESFVREQRKTLFEIFLVAAIVSVLLSIVLANMIANPIRSLARAAHSGGAGAARPLGPDKPGIPDLTHRTDEIGELSGALIGMTGALYARIGAIESFAADVAHEIKNPLSSLRSAVESMGYARSEEQRQRLLDIIESDVRRMDRLVTDISNASRLDAELVRERMQPFDLAHVISVLAAVTEAEGAKRCVRVATRLPEGGFIAHGLEDRIAQVITNLLGNALSFSPEGSTITVGGSLRAEGGVRIEVEDQGPGIPPENLRSIFDRFYSQRPESEAFGKHSGLGLSISKQIVEAHGGRIWAENIPDARDPTLRRGARFVVELPG